MVFQSMAQEPGDVHPESVLCAPDGRLVQLKVHCARWDDSVPENSIPALTACLEARVARAEIDIALLADRDFLVLHDDVLDTATTGSGPIGVLTVDAARRLRLRQHAGERRGQPTEHVPPLLSDIVALLLASHPAPTLLELDAKDAEPWPWPRVEELARLIEPVKDRVVVGSAADWNLRRLRTVAPDLQVGFAPALYLGRDPDRLAPRLVDAIRLVPGAREVHLRLETFEAMLDEGVIDAALIHRLGMRLSVGALDTTTARWRERLSRAVDGGADMIATETPRALSRS